MTPTAMMKKYNVGMIGYGWATGAHIAAINATGNLGGFVGPYIVGLTAKGGDFSAGLYLMAGCALFSALLSLLLKYLKWDEKPA